MIDLENIPSLLITSFFIWMLIRNIVDIQIHLEKKWQLLPFLVFFFVYLLTFPLMMALYAIFWVYRNIVGLLLRIKLGNEFYGLIANFDVCNSVDKMEFSYIHGLTVVECDKKDGDNLYEYYKNLVRNYQEQHEKDVRKLYCTISDWMGILYYKKIKANVDEYVLKLPVSDKVEELDNAEFLKLVSESIYKPLPLNGTMLFSILVGTQPLKSENPNKKQYPIIYRMHHTLGDGISIIKLLNNLMRKDKVEILSASQNIEKFLKEKKPWWKSLFHTVALSLDTFVLLPSLIFTAQFLKKHDHNDIYGKAFVKKDALAYGSDNSRKYFEKVKTIKKKCHNTSFSDIVVTAFTASLRDCLKNRASTFPTHIIAMFPIITSYEFLFDTSDKISMSNEYAALQVKMPIFIENHKYYNKDYPLCSRLEIVKDESRRSKTLTDILFKTTVIPKVAEVLPLPLLRLFLSSFQLTMACSIVPGPSKFIFNEGKFEVSNSTFWIPHLQKLGITLSVFSVAKKLQIGLNSNASLGLDEEAVGDIVNNTYKYLDLLDEEIDNYTKEK